MRWPPWFHLRSRGRDDEPAVAVLLPEPLGRQVDALVARGRDVEAVRLVRVRTGLGLLPAPRRDASARGGGARDLDAFHKHDEHQI